MHLFSPVSCSGQVSGSLRQVRNRSGQSPLLTRGVGVMINMLWMHGMALAAQQGSHRRESKR